MDFQMHDIHEVERLVKHAYVDLKISPDELFIAISRLTNIRESEKLRFELIKMEHEKFEKEIRSEPEPGCGEDE